MRSTALSSPVLQPKQTVSANREPMDLPSFRCELEKFMRHYPSVLAALKLRLTSRWNLYCVQALRRRDVGECG